MEDKEWIITDIDAFWKDFFSTPFKGIIESLHIRFENPQRQLQHTSTEPNTISELLDDINARLTQIHVITPEYKIQEIPELGKLYSVMKDNGFDITLLLVYIDSGENYLSLITHSSDRLSYTRTNWGRQFLPKDKPVFPPEDKRQTIENYLSSSQLLQEKKH